MWDLDGKLVTVLLTISDTLYPASVRHGSSTVGKGIRIMREAQNENVKSCNVYFKTAFKHATPVWDWSEAALRFPSLHLFGLRYQECLTNKVHEAGLHFSLRYYQSSSPFSAAAANGIGPCKYPILIWLALKTHIDTDK